MSNLQTTKARKEAVKPRRMQKLKTTLKMLGIGTVLLSSLFIGKKVLAQEKPVEEPKTKANATLSLGGGVDVLNLARGKKANNRLLVGVGLHLEHKPVYSNLGFGVSAPVDDWTGESKSTVLTLSHVAAAFGVEIVNDKFGVETCVYRNQGHLGVDLGVGLEFWLQVAKKVQLITGAEIDWVGPVYPVYAGANSELPAGFKVGTNVVWVKDVKADADGLGGRLKVSKALTERFSVFADLFAIGTPATREMLKTDFIAGLAYPL